MHRYTQIHADRHDRAGLNRAGQDRPDHTYIAYMSLHYTTLHYTALHCRAGGRLYTWFWGRLYTWCPGVVCTRDSCQRVKIEGSLARNARFEAPTCLLLSLWVLSGFAVFMGEAAKRVVFEGVTEGILA